MALPLYYAHTRIQHTLLDFIAMCTFYTNHPLYKLSSLLPLPVQHEAALRPEISVRVRFIEALKKKDRVVVCTALGVDYDTLQCKYGSQQPGIDEKLDELCESFLQEKCITTTKQFSALYNFYLVRIFN